MVMFGVGIAARPDILFAVDMKMALAVAWATASDCINIAGLTAAMAAASAAASNCSFLRIAWVKSSVMPSRKMIGTIVSAAITATLALWFRAKRTSRRAIMGIATACQKSQRRSMVLK